MFDALVSPFVEFPFMRRALVAVMVLGVSAAPVGVFLMLRRMSLTGDAMAHAILPGVAIGYFVAGLSVGAMTLGGLAAGVAVALAAGAIARVGALKEDATLAAFYLVALALGVLLVSTRGSSVDLLHILFGNVLAVDDDALFLLAGVATATLVVLALVWRALVLDTVDPGFLGAVGRAGGVAHLAFLGLVVANLVAAFQALGTLLGVAVMVLPAVVGRLWSADLDRIMAIAVAVAVLGGAAGLVASYHADTATGPTVVLALGAALFVSLLLGRSGGLLWRVVKRRHLEA
jgi:zinc/manganese transport system permease protein